MAAFAVALWGTFGIAALAHGDLFDEKIKPFVAQHCLDCHDGDAPEGKLSLGQFTDAASAAAKPDVWHKIQTVLRTGKMPPKEQERPPAEETQRVIDWIDRDVLKIDCGAPRDPGRVTIRRLNRREYANTIRDLVGVEFRATDEFPVDDTGYGFDNIGDVLSTSPLLFEKYLAAAEKITSQAIDVDHPRIAGKTTRIEAESLAAEKEDFGQKALGGFLFSGNGRLGGKFVAEKPGQYVVRFHAYGEQAGDEPPKMKLRIAEKEIGVVDVRAVQATPEYYELTAELSAGETAFDFSFENDYYNERARRRRGRDRNLFVDFVEFQGPLDASAKLPETHAKLLVATPRATGGSTEECARKVLGAFATRAYRRPVERDELRRLVSIAEGAIREGESFERGIQLAMQAALISPHFLFRIEADQFPDDPSRPHEITEYELATRLSYFLWSTMPDEALFAEAKAGTLRKNLDAQLRRMMADEKFSAFLTNFSGQWLETRKLATVTPDAKLFAGVDESLRDAMRQETEMFFAHVVREDLPLTALLDARFTFLNEPLARHYGIEGVSGDEFRRVDLADGRRGGILTQASVLTVTSNPTRTSPVKRGKWIMEQILGTPPSPPPPDVPELKEGEEAEATGTLRERMMAHLANPTCASCHISMDGLGLALENYDAVGRWRDRDGKFEIDPSGQTPAGQKFEGPQELRTILAKAERDAFVRCLAEKVLTYALGRGLEYYDKCTLDDLAGATAKADYKFSGLIQSIVHSDAFQKRRAKRPER